MDKATASQLNKKITEAIRPILAEHGMTLKSCNARFDDASFNLAIKSSDDTAPLSSWELTTVGLPADTPRGVEFTFNGTRYTFTGINLRAKKYPIQATRSDGKSYKLPEFASRAIIEALEAKDG